ncbi:Glutathione-binding protein GsiB [Geodia barretti]|uniref:Glutathione-binding protein GsiB n=1 Tax=Geodia barretti TaxID=519541 RepID=A0AA35SDM7_GEOBA|nr:Glutathione-binding protein GsiB [Geodia barretti]
MLAAIACGGAEEPAPTGSQAGSSDAGSQPVQQPTAAEPEATPTPLPASLPTEVVENAVTKDAYPDAEYGGILRRGGYGDPSHYDLMQVSSVSNSFKQMMLLNGLLRYNPLDAGKTIIADLATTWEVSDDGSVWTFPLREGVMFHDGTIMNADDVAASWTRVLDPPAGVVSARKGLYDPFGPSVDVVDPQTVQFTFSKVPPLNYGLNAFALEWHGVFPKSFLEANSYDLKLNGQNAPGTGAFRFLDHQEGEVWKNERFPDYWNEGLPYLDEVWTFPLGSPTNRSAALLAGNVDFAQTVDPAAYELMQNDDRFSGQFVGQPFSSYSYSAIWFNTDREPWNDPRVRRAMWLAIDRDALHEVGGEWFLATRAAPAGPSPSRLSNYRRMKLTRA